MALQLKTQRFLLFGFIGSISLCGLIGIFALLLGEMSDFVGRVLATIATIGGASIVALAAAIPWERKRWQPIGPLGMLAVAIATVLMLVLIWFDVFFLRSNNELLIKALFTACTLAIALPHIGLLSLARLHRAYEIVRIGTVTAITLLALLLIAIVVLEFKPSELLIRFMGTIAILDACGTVAVPILHRVSRIRAQEATVTTAIELSLTCPRCSTTQTLSTGRSKCRSCGLKITLEIEEEHCPKCGYVLYQLTSNACPECGTAVV